MSQVVSASLGAPMDDQDVAVPVDDEGSGVKRADEQPEIPEGRRKLITKWQDEIRADKEYYSDVFKRMREDMEYARLGAKKKWVDGKNYTVPIINRFINQAVASLYAKNPKAVAKRRPKLMYKVWDGTQETAKAALATVQQFSQMSQEQPPQVDPATGQPMIPPEVQQAQEMLQEIQQVKAYNAMVEKAGKTLEILFGYYTGMDFPDFKKQMKANVRRAKTVGVGYTEISFHRAMEADPDITQRIGDMTAKIERIKSLTADKYDGEIDDDPAKLEELESELKTLEEEKMRIVIEGMVFDFPRSTDIIPHRKCRQLSGFIGCDYLTREFLMYPDEIQETFKIDVKGNYKVYKIANGPNTAGGDKEGDRGDDNTDTDSVSTSSKNKKQPQGKACVWKVMNKKTREIFWLCEGYFDYLRPPAPPEVQVRGFWTIYSLIFNEVEDEKEVFPPSDVHYLKDPQQEFNSARQGKREHRKANRPKYFAKKGALEEDEKTTLENAPAHAVIELKGIEADMTIDKLIQPYKGVPIDPALYDTSDIIKDVLYGVGAQSADMGQTGDSTATESSIAESSRMSTLASNVDDLDEHLSEIAEGASQIMLEQLDPQTVLEIVGPGAIWPQLDKEMVSKELFLEIKAGSSGRPNQAAELANLERAMNFLIQLAGVSGPVLAKKYCGLLDIDEEELIIEGMPSIIALNAMATAQAQAQSQIAVNAHPGNPANQPEQPPAAGAPSPHVAPGQQGPAGAQNVPQPAATAGGPQPGMPTPTHRYDAHGGRIQ